MNYLTIILLWICITCYGKESILIGCDIEGTTIETQVHSFSVIFDRINGTFIYLAGTAACDPKNYASLPPDSLVAVGEEECSFIEKLNYALDNRMNIKAFLFQCEFESVHGGTVGRNFNADYFDSDTQRDTFPLIEFLYKDIPLLTNRTDCSLSLVDNREENPWKLFFVSPGFLAWKITFLTLFSLLMAIIVYKLSLFIVMGEARRQYEFNDGFFVQGIEFVTLVWMILWHIDMYHSDGYFNFPTAYVLYLLPMITESIVCYYHAMYYTDVSRSYVATNIDAQRSVSALLRVRKPFGIGMAVLMGINLTMIVLLFTLGATKSFSATVTHTFTNLLLLGCIIFKIHQGLKCTKFIEQFSNPTPEMKRLIVKIKLITLLSTIPLIIMIPWQFVVFILDWNEYPETALIFPIIRSIFIYLACAVNVLSIEPFNKTLLEKKRMCFGLFITPFTASQVSQTNSNSNKSTKIHSKDSSIGTRNSQISIHSIDLEINQTT